MTTKQFLIAVSAAFSFFTAAGQDMAYSFAAVEHLAGGAGTSPATGWGIFSESILNNPDIHKKQLSRHHVQATGYHYGQSEKHFVIHFRKDQLHGQWESFYSNNQRCDSGNLDRGIPHGEWKTWYPNGQLKTVRTYSAQKYHYIKADLHRDHPRLQRYALTRHAQNNRDVSHHFRPAYGVAAPASLTLLQKIQHNTSGKGYAAPFTNCIHHGTYINYDENGALKDSGHYTDGLKDGLWTETGSDGVRASGLYDHGVRQGQWKFYNGEGKLLYTEHYDKNGRKSTPHHFKRNHTKKTFSFHH